MFIDRLLMAVSRSVETILLEPEEEVRIAFVGPPTKVLEEMLERYLGAGGFKVQTRQGETLLPVFLVSENVESTPGETGGKCNDSMLLDQRNKVGSGHFMVLLPFRLGLNLSMQSTVSFIGCDHRGALDDKWVNSNFVKSLLTPVLEQLGGSWSEMLIDLCKHAIIEAGQVPDTSGEKVRQWEVIRQWCDVEDHPGVGNFKLFAACGVPRPSDRSYLKRDAKKFIDLVSRIARQVESLGLLGFFEDMKKKIAEKFSSIRQQELQAAIEGFKDHLFKTLDNAPSFRDAPMYYYSPFRSISVHSQIPAWWIDLDYETWGELLEREVTNGEKTNVRLVNSLVEVDQEKLQVVAKEPTFEVIPSKDKTPFDVVVGHGSITSSQESGTNPFKWKDTSKGKSSSALKFSFQEGELGARTFKVINLEYYIPRAVIYIPELAKVFPFKGKQGKPYHFNCTLQGISAGERYNLTFLFAHTVIPGTEGTMIPEAASGETIQIKGGNDSLRRSNFRIDVGEAGTFRLLANESIEGINLELTYDVAFELSDSEAKGVESEFSRLILKNHGEKNVAINIQPKKIHELQSWVVRSGESYNPLIIGYDCQKHWQRPDWKNAPALTGNHVQWDPRPRELDAPSELLTLRGRILNCLLEEDPFLEAICLCNIDSDDDFQGLVREYLEKYIAWYNVSRDKACWYEVVALMPSAGDGVLAREPDAILFPPTHPLRLAWMLNAQLVLDEALRENRPCPAAGALSPSSIPDCMSFSCQQPGEPAEVIPFFSVNSNNNYWTVLWNGKRIESLWEESSAKEFFDDDFGLTLEGLATGFSKSQVKKSLDDLENLRSGRPILRISIESDRYGDSSSNSGIMTWCYDRLGRNDPWRAAGKRALHVYDYRDDSQSPSSESLANLTVDTASSVMWFKDHKQSVSGKVDLGIINQLGCTSPKPGRREITSAISSGALVRQRIRFSLPTNNHANVFLTESRQAKGHFRDEEGSLQDVLNRAIMVIEGFSTSNSITFAPKIHKLRETIDRASFCAISSSLIDTATFMDTSGYTYLWDYDLPAYSGKPGETSGYFLLSSPSRSILGAVKASLGTLAEPGDALNDNQVKSIIREVSSRGICTVKHLASGGSSANGELGLLVATRVILPLQGGGVLAPMEEGLINLIIPVDPYLAQVDALRTHIDTERRRPDLLVMSIRLLDDGNSMIRLTPIEIKFRSGNMSSEEMGEALKQASSFAPFLNNLIKDGTAPKLWKTIGRNFLAEITGFAFRVQGNLLPSSTWESWASYQSLTIASILSGNAELDIDTRGRAIIINASHENDLHDLEGDGFKETLEINLTGAREILFEENQTLVATFAQQLNGWDFRVPSTSFTKENTSIHIQGESEKHEKEVLKAKGNDFDQKQISGIIDMEATGAWTEAECFLAVWAYDYMDRNRGVVKTWLYNAISALSGRKPKAVEFKLQNVSACDRRARAEKPINEARNIQGLLKEVFEAFNDNPDKARDLFNEIYGDLSFDIREPVFKEVKNKKFSLQEAVLKLLEEQGKVPSGLFDFTKKDEESEAGIEFPAPSDTTSVAIPESPNSDDKTLDHSSKEGIKFNVGTSLSPFSEEEYSLHPSNTDLNQLNMGIVGDLGTGKTQLIKGLVYQLSKECQQNRGVSPKFLIFDYKGDYTTEDFVAATGARVINPLDIPLNLFDSSSSQELKPEISRANFFVDILRKIYGGIGPVQAHNLKKAVKASYDKAKKANQGAPTISAVLEEYTEILGSSVDSPLSILTDIVDRSLFVEDSEKVESFHDFFNGIIVLNLRALGQEDEPKNMLVVMFLNLFYDYMLRLEKKPFLGTDPQLRFIDSFLLVDEADSIMKYEFPVLRNILLQGREFGVGVILASQYLSHFKVGHEDYKEPLLSWFVHKVPNINVNDLKGIGLAHVGSEHVDRIKNLKKHECLFKSLDFDGLFMRGAPFYELVQKDG